MSATDPTTEPGFWSRFNEAIEIAQRPLMQHIEWLVAEHKRERQIESDGHAAHVKLLEAEHEQEVSRLNEELQRAGVQREQQRQLAADRHRENEQLRAALAARPPAPGREQIRQDTDTALDELIDKASDVVGHLGQDPWDGWVVCCNARECLIALVAELRQTREQLAPFLAECDAVGIPHNAVGLVRHHRGNAGMAGAAGAMARYIQEGWWHPNVKSGQVHDHPEDPGRSWSQASHRLCESVYTYRPSGPPTDALEDEGGTDG